MTAPAPAARSVPDPARLSPLWTALRLLGGWATLGVLAYFMWTPGDWPVRLLAWVLLTILADEFGGWFGYLGAALGGLAFFAPAAPPAQWAVIVPLVGGVLVALLLVKHSGGAFVLPFAALVFAVPLLVVGRYGTRIDPGLTLPGNATFQRTALAAMLLGVGFSFVRQLIGVALRYGARRRAERAAVLSPPAPADMPGVTGPAVPGPAVAGPTVTEVIAATPAPGATPVLPAEPQPTTPGRPD